MENEDWEYLSDGSDVTNFLQFQNSASSILKCAAFNPYDHLFIAAVCDTLVLKGVFEIPKSM